LLPGMLEDPVKVIAFEPASKSFLRLSKNISMNGLTNIVPERKAIIDRNTQIELYISNRHNMGMSSIFHHDNESGITEKVEAILWMNMRKRKASRGLASLKSISKDRKCSH